MNIKYWNETYNDKWIIEEVFKGKKNGFYIEAGACDGKYGSSTYVLEKHFEWTGLLVEPNPKFVDILSKTRPNSICVNKGLSSFNHSGEYYHFDGRVGYNGFPSLNALGEDSWWKKINNNVESNPQKYTVDCVTLESLLVANKSPKTIDYLCLDTEGSELDILKNFPFNDYKIKCISLEAPPKELVDILKNNNYTQVYNKFNDVDYEFYFIHKDHINN